MSFPQILTYQLEPKVTASVSRNSPLQQGISQNARVKEAGNEHHIRKLKSRAGQVKKGINSPISLRLAFKRVF